MPRRVAISDPDPMPQPPPRPAPEDCCGSGCNPCIFELHERATERWRDALRAWRKRHAKEAADTRQPKG